MSDVCNVLICVRVICVVPIRVAHFPLYPAPLAAKVKGRECSVFYLLLRRAVVAPATGDAPYGRRPAGGRPRAAPGSSRARPQAAARQAAGAAAGPGSGQQEGARGAGGAEGGGEQAGGDRLRRAARRRRTSRCQYEWRPSGRCDKPRLLRLRPAAVGDGRRPREASGVPEMPRAEDTDDVLVRRELPGGTRPLGSGTRRYTRR